MRTVQVVIVSLAALVIVTATQVPFATTLQTRADYDAAINAAATEYRAARAECRPIAGHDRDMCIVLAKAAEVRAKAAADEKYLGTIKAKSDRRIANADADWMIARASCDAKLQPEKSACVQKAKFDNLRVVMASEANSAR